MGLIHKKLLSNSEKIRPKINICQRFFDQRNELIDCDLLAFFQTICRIPYEDNLFATIASCAKKYVLVSWVEEAATGNFPRDIHLGMSKIGFVCIEKRVVNSDFIPYGKSPNDQKMISPDNEGNVVPHFMSFFLFRRIEPK